MQTLWAGWSVSHHLVRQAGSPAAIYLITQSLASGVKGTGNKKKEEKKEARTVEVRNANHQVRPLQACVTETLSHMHTPCQLLLHKSTNKDHKKKTQVTFKGTVHTKMSGSGRM